MFCGKEDAILMFKGRLYPLSLQVGLPEMDFQFYVGHKCMEMYQLNVDREAALLRMGSEST